MDLVEQFLAFALRDALKRRCAYAIAVHLVVYDAVVLGLSCDSLALFLIPWFEMSLEESGYRGSSIIVMNCADV